MISCSMCTIFCLNLRLKFAHALNSKHFVVFLQVISCMHKVNYCICSKEHAYRTKYTISILFYRAVVYFFFFFCNCILFILFLSHLILLFFEKELDHVVEELEKVAVVNLLQHRSIISLIGNVQRSSLILEKVLYTFCRFS